METHMLGTHQSTYDALFQHPIARNLQWRDVRSMLTALADDVTEEHNGNMKFTCKGHTLTVHPPRRKDFSDVQELMHIRQFLEQSGGTAPAVSGGTHLLVVIDHREARIYKAELHGSVPERITPYDPDGSHRHLHNVEDDSNGQRKPELKSFYEAIAKTLNGAEKILLFGNGTGASSAMEQLLADLEHHHKDLHQKVIASVVVDDHHLTEGQLLAKAREIYATLPAHVSSDSRK